MPYSKPVLSHAEVEGALAAILLERGDDMRPIAVAVADETGDLLAFIRTDRCPPFTGSMARAKAYSAARTRKDTGAFRDFLLERSSTASAYGDPGLVAIQGGVVVIDDYGHLLGAIAVSGLAPDEDEQLARHGLAALRLH